MAPRSHLPRLQTPHAFHTAGATHQAPQFTMTPPTLRIGLDAGPEQKAIGLRFGGTSVCRTHLLGA